MPSVVEPATAPKGAFPDKHGQFAIVLTLVAASVVGVVAASVTAAEDGHAGRRSSVASGPREIRIEAQRFPPASVFTVVGATVEQVVSPQAGTLEIHFDANNQEPPAPAAALDMGPRA